MPCAVIVTALRVEYLAVRAHLNDIQEEVSPQGSVYERGRFAGNGQTWEVGIVEIGAGNAGAALEAERAIAYFNPEVVLFVGVAVGIKDVALGDVVVASKIYSYDSGGGDEGYRSETTVLPPNLVQLARDVAKKVGWLERLSSQVSELTPHVFVAPIAVGEKVIASTESVVFQRLQEIDRNAIAVEMEGLGFLEAVRANQQISAIVIRGIADLLDDKGEVTEDNSQEMAARHASAFAFELLTKSAIQTSNVEPIINREPENLLTLMIESKQLLRNRYEILSTIGRGGFGITVLAKDKSLPDEPRCIVKQLLPKTNNVAVLQRASERFRQEAKTLGKLGNHPQIPRLLDYFESEGKFYLIQEYIEGSSLAKIVRSSGSFSEAAVKQFLREFLPLLQDIHENQTIHRDIKPTNIIREKQEQKFVLTDFGAVKEVVSRVSEEEQAEAEQVSSESRTTTEEKYDQFVGSVGFAPPEQLALRPVYASDIYALGVTCLYLLTGKPPIEFDCDSQTGEVLWRDHIQVDENFSKILDKMLKISVSDRYSSASEVLQDLNSSDSTDILNNETNISEISLYRRQRRLEVLRERYNLLSKYLETLQREHTFAKNTTRIHLLRKKIEQVEAEIDEIAQQIDELDSNKPEQVLLPFQAPPLTSHFVEREHIFQPIKRLILTNDSNAANLTQAIVIQGMGGVGKTTLAAAIAHDPEIQQQFSDGTLWADLYARDIFSILNAWVQALGDHNFQATTPEVTSAHLRTLLANKAVFLVIDGLDDASDLVINGSDNASDSYKMQLLLVGGKHCYTLITSRNRSIAPDLEASTYVLDVMTSEESVALLSGSLERSLNGTERDEALKVAQMLGHLPLALELAAAQIKRGVSWAELEQKLSNVRELLAEHGSDRHRLRELVNALYENRASTEESLLQTTISYSVQIVLKTASVLVGSELEIVIRLSQAGIGDDRNVYWFEVPFNSALGGELNIFLVANGFQFNGSNSASLPLNYGDAFLENFSQVARFKLTALRQGMATIEAELYYGDVLETVLETIIQVVQPEAIKLNALIASRSRPVPQPDLILQVQTIWNENLSTYTFRYHLNSFHPRLPFAREIEQRSETLSAGWLEQTRSLLQTTLEEAANSLPEDFRARLTSLGQHLFQQLLPPELQTTFRSVMHFNQPFTLLILADQDAGLPWELLHDGQGFWGERFVIGRWFWELDQTRPYEFAIGAINVAHYADVEQTEQWTSLLEPVGAPSPMMLSGGVLADLSTVDAMRGLHLLRRGKSVDEADRQDAPVPLNNKGAENLEQDLQSAKLSLRRNRPLVTLGYVSAGLPELTSLEQSWAPTFIRSGCSAFVGSLWAVQPAVEAAFISSFYHRLWTGDSLGIAFQAGRRAARSLVPDSLDWMAYTLFGDPMARPYRPTQGKGYAVVEPVGQEITDAIAPGASVRFRVSLRRTPPVWYTNRLMDVAEDLAFNDLQVYIAASGLQVAPAESMGMQRTPTGDYLGWFTLTVPSTFAGESALVQVHFEDGIDPIHSLRFSVTVASQEGEQP